MFSVSLGGAVKSAIPLRTSDIPQKNYRPFQLGSLASTSGYAVGMIDGNNTSMGGMSAGTEPSRISVSTQGCRSNR